MKKSLKRVMITMLILLLCTGCSKSKTVDPKEANQEVTTPKSKTENTNAANTEKPKETEKSLEYTTITEWFDWGPAITKVILNLGVSVDQATLSTDTFVVSSVRSYNQDGSAPDSTDEPSEVETQARKVLKVYSSDKNGKNLTGGTYITFEMEVGSEIVAGSPMNYNTSSSFCNFVDTSYIIELSKEAKLKSADGKQISITPTNKDGYVGNKNMIPDGFDYSGKYKQGDTQLLYGSFTPQKASEKGKTPLIVWLHGHSEGGGQDARLAVYSNYTVNLASEKIQSYFGDTGAFVLIPQARTFWMDYDGNIHYNDYYQESEGKSYYTEALMGLIKDYVAKHPEIDTNRIYIGGYSNGGYMSINMITEYPDYFTAAFPACGPYYNEWMTDEKLKKIVDIPIWFTHCKKDTTVKIYETEFDGATNTIEVKKDEDGKEIPIYEHANALYDRLKKAGAKNVHYSLLDSVLDTSGRFFKAGTTEPYEYNGHFSWMYVLNNSCTDTIDGKKVTIMEWLGKQSKK